jgi:hypothetical protein
MESRAALNVQHHHTDAMLAISMLHKAKQNDANCSIHPIDLAANAEGKIHSTFPNTLLFFACLACLSMANIKHRNPISCSIKTKVIIPALFLGIRLP